MCYNIMMYPTYSSVIVLSGFAISNSCPWRSLIFIIAE